MSDKTTAAIAAEQQAETPEAPAEALPAITITSEELRERVEEHLGHWIPDSLWERSEPYARRKLDLCRERSPEIDYYNDEYLVLLTADTVRETAFSDFTIAACEALMTARGQ